MWSPLWEADAPPFDTADDAPATFFDGVQELAAAEDGALAVPHSLPPASGCGDAAALRATAPREAPREQALRCADVLHAADCTECAPHALPRPVVPHFSPLPEPPGWTHRCTPAPARTEHGFFELTGPGGIKALRGLVLCSAEWNSEAERHAVAAAEDALGDPCGIARVLRNKSGRDLTKAHLLLLCHTWGYRSNKWCVL